MLIAAVAGAPAVGASPAPDPAEAERGRRWELVWSDEFDGSALDEGDWTLEVVAEPHNEELQYYTDREGDGANAWLEDGNLVIEARSEDFEHRHYTSARLNTAGKREFLYGRFEARIRQPGETGMWPAFWLLGSDIDEIGWPACGEIDVMEGKGRLPRWTSGALHYGADPESHQFVSHELTLESGSFQEEWHEFAVEWAPEAIRWFVDDELVETVTKPPEATPTEWPFDRGVPFFVILNLAVGGWFDSGHPPPEDMEPQRLLVDWVRVYSAAGADDGGVSEGGGR